MAFESGGRGPVGSDGLGRWGRVAKCDGPPGWLVVEPDGSVVEPVAVFLRDFAARGHSSGSVRSYAYALLRWWRWLRRVEVAWDRASPAEVRDLVLWLDGASKPRRFARTASAATAGRVNAVTGKIYPSDRYAPRTVRHSNAVIRAFYEFWLEQGRGPLVNPVVLVRAPGGPGGRPHAHHNPLQPFRSEGRLRHNPKVPKRRPRALSDEQWEALFSVLRCDRDRALCAIAVSSAARAGELLGMRPMDVDWGEQLVRVVRKGSRAEQWLPASSEAFVWLRLYLAGLGTLAADEPLWWTLRGHGPASPQPRFTATSGGPVMSAAAALESQRGPDQWEGAVHREGAGRTPAPRGEDRGTADGLPPGRTERSVLRRYGHRPLSYPALRAVLTRANRVLGTNYSWHDLRHTAALRMSRDESLSLRDVQTVLGHASVVTTAETYLFEDEAHVLARVSRHLSERAEPAAEPTPATGYDPAILAVLLGGDQG